MFGNKNETISTVKALLCLCGHVFLGSSVDKFVHLCIHYAMTEQTYVESFCPHGMGTGWTAGNTAGIILPSESQNEDSRSNTFLSPGEGPTPPREQKANAWEKEVKALGRKFQCDRPCAQGMGHEPCQSDVTLVTSPSAALAGDRDSANLCTLWHSSAGCPIHCCQMNKGTDIQDPPNRTSISRTAFLPATLTLAGAQGLRVLCSQPLSLASCSLSCL